MSEHTKGKLIAETYDDGAFELAIDGAGYSGGTLVIASRNKHTGRPMEMQANARRLVAAWNACEGISTEALESEGSAVTGWTRTASKLINEKSRGDKLLSALKGMLAIVSDSRGVTGYHLNGDEALWAEFPEADPRPRSHCKGRSRKGGGRMISIALQIVCLMVFVLWLGTTIYDAGKGISPRPWEVVLLLTGTIISTLVDIVVMAADLAK